MPVDNQNNKKNSEIDIDNEIHDVKTPLTALKLQIQLLKKQVDRLPQQAPVILFKKLLDQVDNGLDELNRKLNDLRDKFKKKK